MNSFTFTKMHGLGNDFVVVDFNSNPNWILTEQTAKQICDRRFGIGADQILWLKPPHDSTLDSRMEIRNADGSVAEMCGNGIRAVGLFLEKKKPNQAEYRIETLAGVKTVQKRGSNFRVNMGLAQLGKSFFPNGEEIKIRDQIFHFFEVNVGNPHAVIFVERDAQSFAEKFGPWIERHTRFPQRTNVEFVEIKQNGLITARVWERGAGLTLACGTGACAAAVASLALHKVDGKVIVDLPGGQLNIEWQGQQHPIWMEGPATEVFHGSFTLSS